MSVLETVKKAYVAWESKDIEALSEILHADYKAKMPGGMEIVGIEGAKQCLDNCPFDGSSENELYITEGNNVVRLWDFVVKSPTPFRMRMAELSVVKDGKILFNEAFFDSTSFPKEISELCDQTMEKMKKTATVSAG